PRSTTAAPARTRSPGRCESSLRFLRWDESYPLAGSQRTVAGRREPEGRAEDAGEVRLIREARVTGHVDQRALLMDQLSREVEATHEQVAVGARAEHVPELTGQIVASQPGDGLELRRMHDPGSLGVEKPPSALRGGNVDPGRAGR